MNVRNRDVGVKFNSISNNIYKSDMFRFRFSNLAYYKRGYIATTDTHQPVDMSYTTYETTVSSRPPLIVMHGLLGSKANWHNVCKNLNKNTNPPRKIVAVDARNHGDSPHSENHSYEHLVQDLRALMGKLKLTKASLMGHSMGGRAVMLCALKNVSCGWMNSFL